MRLICGILTALLLHQQFIQVKSVSIWSAYCNEELLYFPYIRIWKGNADNRKLIKDRGPGFIDVRGMNDIYVCTNGLTMFYFANTHQMGDVFEDAVLRWLPHTCQLFNPTKGPGGTQPFKTLQALLLIGHPKDYRNPSLQLFVAPYYDKGEYNLPKLHVGYVNYTSMLMVNSEGECIVENGIEHALIRVMVNEPAYKIKDDKATAFCRLDATRYLGQNEDIQTALKGRTVTNSGKLNVPIMTSHGNRMIPGLHTDMSLRFKGCLRYPLFDDRMFEVIKENYCTYVAMNSSKVDFSNLEGSDKYNPTPQNSHDDWFQFWDEEVRGMTRRDRYFGVTLITNDNLKLEDVQKSYDEAVEKLQEERSKDPPNYAVMQQLEEEEYKYYVILEIYQYLVDYAKAYSVITLNYNVNTKAMWTETYDDLSKGINVIKAYEEYKLAMQNISDLRAQQRLAPYDPTLLTQSREYESILESKYNDLVNASVEMGKVIAQAEVCTANYWRLKPVLDRRLDNLVRAMRIAEKRENLGVYKPVKMPMTDKIYPMYNIKEDDYSVCDYLAAPKETCRNIKPTSARASEILKARQGKTPNWEAQDEWRDTVLGLITRIFSIVCPYLPSSEDFANSINNVVKGYLMKYPNGTGIEVPLRGGRFYGVGAGGEYLNETYNNTRSEMAPSLRGKNKFWDFVIAGLEKCVGGVKGLEIYDAASQWDANPQESRMVFRKFFINNNSYMELELEQLYMSEQADQEYSLNWAIDMNWKIFATVLGSCLPYFENNAPLIYSKFYSLYSQDFLHPIRQIWMSNRDNVIFQYIFGNYYGNNKGSYWTRNCMESSFVNSGDPNFRPLRWLYVNQFSELNFFTTGPMAGTSGIYFD